MTDSVIPPEDRCECGVYRKTECERGCLRLLARAASTPGNLAHALYADDDRRCARDEWQARMKARAPLEDRG